MGRGKELGSPWKKQRRDVRSGESRFFGEETGGEKGGKNGVMISYLSARDATGAGCDPSYRGKMDSRLGSVGMKGLAAGKRAELWGVREGGVGRSWFKCDEARSR